MPSLTHPQSQPCVHNLVPWVLVNSPVLGTTRECSAVPMILQPDSSIQDRTRVFREEEHGRGGWDRSCISPWKLSPSLPCPADLLEPLHQPRGQSRWDVEQKSLLLQLPQRRCEPVGQDPQWPHKGQARARPADPSA